MEIPDVQYARSGDVAIAYQIVGEGPTDIVFARGFSGELLSMWEHPLLRRHVEGLAEAGRVLMLDKRGTGLGPDARGCDAGGTDGRPRRGHGRGRLAARGLLGQPRERAPRDPLRRDIPGAHERAHPSRAIDPRPTGARLSVGAERRGVAPADRGGRRALGPTGLLRGARGAVGAGRGRGSGVRRLVRYAHAARAQPGRGGVALSRDAGLGRRRRPRCGASADDGAVQAGGAWPAEYVADRVAKCELVELPRMRGIYTWIDDETHEASIAAIKRFVERVGRASEPDRVLATILFTDIVGSSARAAELGDLAWRDLLRTHHTHVRRRLAEFRRRGARRRGDGFLASFDGPGRAIRCACAIRAASPR